MLTRRGYSRDDTWRRVKLWVKIELRLGHKRRIGPGGVEGGGRGILLPLLLRRLGK